MGIIKKYIFRRRGISPPNTFIGGVGNTVVTTKGQLASKISIGEEYITNFVIDSNNNVSCHIGANYTMNGSAFFRDDGITYYIDMGGKCTFIDNQAFANPSNASQYKVLIFPNVTGCNSNNWSGGGAGTRNHMGIICLPKLEPIGSTGTTNNNNFSWTNYTHNVYVNSINQTNNAGSPDLDISGAISSAISSWVKYSTNQSQPENVTGLSTTDITSDTIYLQWDAITHSNNIDYYIVFKDGNIVGITNGATTTFTASGLVQTTEYNFKVLAIDSQGNNNTFSEEIAVTTLHTPNTFIGGVSSNINTPQLLANRLIQNTSASNLPVSDIQGFRIDGPNIECYIGVQYRIVGFRYDTDLSYYNDMDSNCTYIGSAAMANTPNFQTFILNGVTSTSNSALQQSGLTVVDNMKSVVTLGTLAFYRIGTVTSIELPSMVSYSAVQGFRLCTSLSYLYIPLCTTFGPTTGNDGMFTSVPVAGLTVVASDFLETNNGGNMDGDLQVVVDGGGSVIFAGASNPIIDLATVFIYETAFKVDWSEPIGGYTVTDYAIYLDDVIVDTVPSTQLSYVFLGLTNLVTYKVVVKAVNTWGIESADSNILNTLLNGTNPSITAYSDVSYYDVADVHTYYKFNTDYTDETANNYTATPINSPVLNAVEFDLPTVQFDGSTNYLTLPNAAGYNSSQTVMCWFMLEDPIQSGALYSKGSDASNGWGLYNAVNATTASCNIVTTSPTTGWSTSGAVTIVAGVFYHYATTWDDATNTLKIYLNGVLVSSKVQVGTTLRGTTNVYIGAYRLGNVAIDPRMFGSIADFSITKRALTQEEFIELGVIQ